MSNGVTGWFKYCLLVITLVSPTAHSDQDLPRVQKLLAEMSTALRELNYQGLFTYEHGGALVETLRIIHTVNQGIENERIEHLNGPPREVVRRGKAVSCTAPGEALLRGQLEALGTLDKKVHQLVSNYGFQLRGRQRVAGREAIFIQVLPKDEYRYGFTLAIDIETRLPLMSILVGHKNNVLERFQFVELSVGADINLQDIEPATDAYLEIVSDSQCEPMDTLQAQRWNAAWLPKGYVFSGQKTTQSEGDMLTYTDGLSTFSIFVEAVQDGLILEGRAQRGATVAHMSKVANLVEPYSVTVVGEIPPLAAQRIAASVRPKQQ